MVTHDPKAATIADRILFSPDGMIVRISAAQARGVAGRDGRVRPDVRSRSRDWQGGSSRRPDDGHSGRRGDGDATFVFTDSIDKALDTLFTDAYTGSDA
jgi:hypothetical protein